MEGKTKGLLEVKKCKRRVLSKTWAELPRKITQLMLIRPPHGFPSSFVKLAQPRYHLLRHRVRSRSSIVHLSQCNRSSMSLSLNNSWALLTRYNKRYFLSSRDGNEPTSSSGHPLPTFNHVIMATSAAKSDGTGQKIEVKATLKVDALQRLSLDQPKLSSSSA